MPREDAGDCGREPASPGEKSRQDASRSSSFLPIVLDSILEEISVIDRSREIVYVNRAFADRFGQELRDLIGRKCFDVLCKRQDPCEGCPCDRGFAGQLPDIESLHEDRPGPGCFRARALVTGTPIAQSLQEDTPDGTRYLECRTFPLLDPKGEVTHVIHCLRDVTSQRNMEDALRRQREQLGRMLREVRHVRDQNDALNAQLIQAEKLASLGEMASIMAHELDSPLSTILGHADMLKSKSPDEECRKRLTSISRQASRCHEIIRRTLDFARQPAPTMGPVDLNGIVRQVGVLLEHALRRRRAALAAEVDESLPSIQGDHHALTQVCFNLLRNAMEAVDAGGEVRVRTAASADGRHVALEVEDSGSGLPPGDVATIFRPFYTTKQPGKGTGLGLAICQSIVQAHGGRITAENRPGGGARFRVELPIQGPPTGPGE